MLRDAQVPDHDTRCLVASFRHSFLNCLSGLFLLALFADRVLTSFSLKSVTVVGRLLLSFLYILPVIMSRFSLFGQETDLLRFEQPPVHQKVCKGKQQHCLRVASCIRRAIQQSH